MKTDILVGETPFRFTMIFHKYTIGKPEIYQLVW